MADLSFIDSHWRAQLAEPEVDGPVTFLGDVRSLFTERLQFRLDAGTCLHVWTAI